MVRLSISLMIGVFLIYSLAHGGVVGDVNGDGKVGLEEAVHALQVTAGIKTNNVNNDNNDRKEWGLGSVFMDYDQDGINDVVLINTYLYPNMSLAKYEFDVDQDGTIDDLGTWTYEINYDQHGNKIRAIVFKNGVAQDIVTYMYDRDNNMITENNAIYYCYDAQGNQVKRIYGSTGYSTDIRVYDENGNIIISRTLNADGTTVFAATSYYDENGRRTRIEVDYGEDGILDRIHIYAYDANGNMIRQQIDLLSNGEIVDTQLTYFIWLTPS